MTTSTYFPLKTSASGAAVTFSGCAVNIISSTSSICNNYVKPIITDSGSLSASQLINAY